MTVTDIVPVITALAALIGAIAAAFWGHGLANAKDEVIKAKEAQLEALRSNHEQVLIAMKTHIGTLEREIVSYRELTPVKIREYFLSVKEQLEEYVDKLRADLRTAQCALEEKDLEIERLLASDSETSLGIETLQRERDELLSYRLQVDREIERLRKENQQIERLRTDVDANLERLEELRPTVTQSQAKRPLFSHTCTNCGYQASSSAIFCPGCGKPLMSDRRATPVTSPTPHLELQS